jgi:hypothetical protein
MSNYTRYRHQNQRKVKWSASCFGHFTPSVRAPFIHCMGGLVGPRDDFNVLVKRKALPLPGIKLQLSSPWSVTLLISSPALY